MCVDVSIYVYLFLRVTCENVQTCVQLVEPLKDTPEPLPSARHWGMKFCPLSLHWGSNPHSTQRIHPDLH